MRIDLHTHSTCSDGTDTPAELVANAAVAGLDVIALTDHDSFAGWEAAQGAADSAGVRLVPGVEMSTKLAGQSVHVLGYFPDPHDPDLVAELDRIRDQRRSWLPAQLALLAGCGLKLTEEQVLRAAGPSVSLGRPHVADAIVAAGLAADRTEVFDRWLGDGLPGHLPKYAPATANGVALLSAAGAIPVLAHPRGRGEAAVLTREVIAGLAEAGLGGLEVDHQLHGPAQRAELAGIADEFDLIRTGSSDYHGDGKRDHDLGCELTDPEQFDRLLATRSTGRP